MIELMALLVDYGRRTQTAASLRTDASVSILARSCRLGIAPLNDNNSAAWTRSGTLLPQNVPSCQGCPHRGDSNWLVNIRHSTIKMQEAFSRIFRHSRRIPSLVPDFWGGLPQISDTDDPLMRRKWPQITIFSPKSFWGIEEAKKGKDAIGFQKPGENPSGKVTRVTSLFQHSFHNTLLEDRFADHIKSYLTTGNTIDVWRFSLLRDRVVIIMIIGTEVSGEEQCGPEIWL